jgi:uncharacterized protein YceK
MKLYALVIGSIPTAAKAGILSAVLLVVVGVAAARAATVDTIYRFDGGPDGSGPTTGLVLGPEDALYAANESTVYQLKQDAKGKWGVTPIYATLDGPPLSIAGDGGSLFLAFGEVHGKPCPQDQSGCGAIIELTPPSKGHKAWTPTTVYNFKGGKDGVFPGGITIANGVIYGTTGSGGGSSACGTSNNTPDGCGTLFELKKSKGIWADTVLHRFQGGSDGAFPFAAPALDAVGNVYATTNQGGDAPGARAPVSNGGNGTVVASEPKRPKLENYEIIASKLRAAYYDSQPLLVPRQDMQPSSASGIGNSPAAAAASAAIVPATGGGNTTECADLDDDGCGVVFALIEPADDKTPWTYKSLHNFSGPDGFLPGGYLLPVGADKIYGVAYGGVVNDACGQNGCGVIYQLTKGKSGWAWGGTVYKFSGGSKGFAPIDGLTLYKGMILGAAAAGGTGCGSIGCGTIFEFKP